MISLKEFLIESQSAALIESQSAGFAHTLNMDIPHKQDRPDVRAWTKQRYVQFIEKQFPTGGKKFQKFVSDSFDAWEKEFDKEYDKVPFRIKQGATSNVKLASWYFEIAQKYGIDKTRAWVNVDGVKVYIGNGLGGGARGVKFESELYNGLLIYTACGLDLEHPDIAPEARSSIEAIVKNDKLKEVLQAIFDAAAKEENPDTAVRTYIQSTGASNTFRGIQNIMNDSDFDVQAEIISDITITNPRGRTKYFISAKRNGQNSGVRIDPKRAGDEWMVNTITQARSGVKYDDIVGRELFDKFWKKIGVNPEEIVTAYNNLTEKTPIDITGINTNETAAMIKRLIGAKYYYTTPNSCFYVKDIPLTFVPDQDKSYITDSGRGIQIGGTVNGKPCLIKVRTDGNEIPRRLFVELDVEAIFK